MNAVTIIIPTWNRADLLQQALQGLRQQTLSPSEVLVVDNGSTDDSVQVAEQAGARVLALGRNAGFSAAVNAGIRACHTPWLVVLNNDVILREDWLERLLCAAEQEQAWFATGKLLMTNDPSLLDGSFDLISRAACAVRAGHGEKDGPEWSVPRRIQIAPFTAVLFRKELFTEVGDLEERFESYLEDVEFGFRCALRGHTGIYVPEAVAFHQGSATLGRWHTETVRRIARNQVWIVAKHYPDGWIRTLGWPVLVGQLLWAGVAFRHGGGLAWLRGKWQGISTFREFRRLSPPRANGRQVAQVLADSEQHLRLLQQSAPVIRYWRWYFRLT